ncbi:MAG: site-specific integrase [Synergistota bacterium]|nr:site-specific integrase [Synergistota bacterium]
MPKLLEGMPSGIRPRGDKFQWTTSHKGERMSGTADSMEEAVRDRAKALQSLLSVVRDPRKSKMSLKKAVDGAVANKWAGTPAEETALKNARACIKFFGADILVEDIDEELIDEFRDALRAEGNTSATINRKTSALSVILKFAFTRKGMSRLPLIGRLRENNTHERYVSDEEERQLIHHFLMWGKREHALTVIILVDTGMRSGELFSLRRSAIDWDRGQHGTINLWKQNTKTKRSRVVPLTERASKALRELADMRSEVEDDDPRVLPYDRYWLNHAWLRVRDLMGLSECEVFTPHLLRHTYCSRLAKAGVPLQKIAYLAGHTSIKTTMRYAHLSPLDCDGVLDVLDRVKDIPSIDREQEVV